MKKFLLLTVVLSLVGALFLSCNKTPDPEEETVSFETPVYADDAVAVSFASLVSPPQEALPMGSDWIIPERMVFTESGRFVFLGSYATKAASDKFTFSDLYSLLSGDYRINGLGITVHISGNTVTITLSNGDVYEYDGVSIKKAKSPQAGTEANLVRSWKPDGKVTITIDHAAGIVTTHQEPDLGKIGTFLVEHEVHIDETRYQDGYIITDITLSLADNSFIIAFQNNDAFVGNWKWTDQEAGEFLYEFTTDLGGSFVNGSAHGTVSFFREGNVNKCNLKMEVAAKGTKAFIDFTLKEA